MWLTQSQMAELFQTDRISVLKHMTVDGKTLVKGSTISFEGSPQIYKVFDCAIKDIKKLK